MIEHKIIKCALINREAFDKLKESLNREELSSYGNTIVKLITNYYEADLKVDHIDEELLTAVIRKRYPKQLEEFEAYIARLPEEVSVANIVEYIQEQQREILGNKIAAMMIEDTNNPKIVEAMNEFQLLNSEVQEEQRVYDMSDLGSLLERIAAKKLIPIYPTAVNNRIGGGIPRQGQMLVYARPDVGKSTVVMNIAGGAVQSGYTVLYCGNEDPADTMVLRYMTRMTGMVQDEIKKNPKVAIEKAAKATQGNGKCLFVDMHPGSIAEIRANVQKYNPDIVIVDQIRLIKMVKDNPTRNLEEACIAMRTLAKEFHFVSVLVTQAGDSAKGKLYLQMEDVEWSNTGVQGQMDLMIGVGQNTESKAMNNIMLSFPKNKLSAPIQPFSCRINYPLNKVMGPDK